DVCSSDLAATTVPFDAVAAAAGYTDNCSDVTVRLDATDVTGDDCSWTLTYTFTVIDVCGNELPDQTIVHTGGDETAPTGTAPTGTTDNEACMDDAATTVPFDAVAAAAGYTDNCSDVTV